MPDPSIENLVHAYGEYRESAGPRETARKFAEGAGGEAFANPRVQLLFARSKVNTVEDFNYASIPIRAVASRLRLRQPGATRATSDAPATEANEALTALWDDNQLGAEAGVLHKLAETYGDAYLMVWPRQDDAGTTLGVDLLVNSPESVRAVYDPEHPLTMLYVIKVWEEGKTTRATMYYPDHVEKWRGKRDGRFTGAEGWWERVPGEDDIPTPDGQIPWVHFRNDRPYGQPAHLEAYGPQRMINKMVSALGTMVDFTIGPQRYYLADPSMDDPHQNLNDPDYPEDDEDDPEEAALSGSSTLSADPQSVWKLYGRSAGQFDAADPARVVNLLDRCVQAMAELTGIPRHHFGWGTGETPSGAALRSLDIPLAEIEGDRRDAYGSSWRVAFERALSLLGLDGYRVAVRWAPTVTITDSEGWQVIAAMISSGVPPRRALETAGFLPEEIQDWIKDSTGSDTGHRLSQMQTLSATLQALAAALTGGKPADQGSAATPPATPPTVTDGEPAPDQGISPQRPAISAGGNAGADLLDQAALKGALNNLLTRITAGMDESS